MELTFKYTKEKVTEDLVNHTLVFLDGDKKVVAASGPGAEMLFKYLKDKDTISYMHKKSAEFVFDHDSRHFAAQYTTQHAFGCSHEQTFIAELTFFPGYRGRGESHMTQRECQNLVDGIIELIVKSADLDPTPSLHGYRT
jgi:hypothetical protein